MSYLYAQTQKIIVGIGDILQISQIMTYLWTSVCL